MATRRKEEIRYAAKRTILIVEDNEINRMMLSELLSSEYMVLEAENANRRLMSWSEKRMRFL